MHKEYNSNNKNVKEALWSRQKGGIMKTLIGLIVLFCIFSLPIIIRNYKFDSRTSPDGYTTDFGAMNRDLAKGMSKADVQNKFNRGGYNVKQ